MNRADYVASLKVERAAMASRPVDHPARARRLADIDAELDRYAEEPVERRQEAAVSPAAVPVASVPVEVAVEPASAADVAPIVAAKK